VPRLALDRLTSFLRKFWWTVLALVLVGWAWLNPSVMNLALLGAGFLANLLFAMMFMVVQFGALFWFISRTRTVVIRPGDPKSVTFESYWGQPHLVELVTQWISLLSDRHEFVKMGGQYINGLLLTGEPGTGKPCWPRPCRRGQRGLHVGGGLRLPRMFWDGHPQDDDLVRKARKLARNMGLHCPSTRSAQ
jgi:cell division protease FtsH